MVTNEMCAFIGKAHEFFLVLKKAGFTDELIQEIINSKDNFMAQEMFESLRVEETTTSILSNPFSSCIVPGTISKFVAKDNFVFNISKRAGVKISFIGSGFINWFLEKTEKPFPGSFVWGRKLYKNSFDNRILAELGGHEKAKTTLFELFTMMKRQAKGENGRLLNNGWSNIFYILDINGILRVVNVYWSGNGWGIDAASIKGLGAWPPDFCVFSRVEKNKN